MQQEEHNIFEGNIVSLYLICFSNSLQNLGFNVWFVNNGNTTQGYGETNTGIYTVFLAILKQIKPLEIMQERDTNTTFEFDYNILLRGREARLHY